VWHIDLGWAGSCDKRDSIWESPFARETAAFFRAYVLGESFGVPQLPLAWHRVSGFTAYVLSTLQNRVACGEWVSYSRLADLCGVPGGARAVGGVMSGNPWPLLVPCHRVLRKNGQIGGFSSGVELKRLLLRLEGLLPAKG
jgi:methylated-DNA-[protein]-cysteine S-methyltransferase